MTSREGFFRALQQHPEDDALRLVYADFLEEYGDEQMEIWAHNSRVLLARQDLFDYYDWCEGGLVRENRRLG